ncbi:hypothetical protein ED208_12530 [Stagnimonas aquatica]|uniref:Uncharacterized protein n=1 Tax=Stagnimonas aquatica TaxID=2689987 RepID=A0A3N0V8G2_9GAMM|nr:hypothetical protein [Stagnimonas aquatica]ROH88638.1 hypothetical protein ED208_12530 [Stagnimonas aquatica]
MKCPLSIRVALFVHALLDALLALVMGLRRIPDLVLSPDGTLSLSKGCYLLYVYVFTRKMLATMPDDPLLWLVYGGTVGGVEVAKKYISSRYLGAPSQGQSP